MATFKVFVVFRNRFRWRLGILFVANDLSLIEIASRHRTISKWSIYRLDFLSNSFVLCVDMRRPLSFL